MARGAFDPNWSSGREGMAPAGAAALTKALGLQFQVSPENMADAAFYGADIGQIMAALLAKQRDIREQNESIDRANANMVSSYNNAAAQIGSTLSRGGMDLQKALLEEEGRTNRENTRAQGQLSAAEARMLTQYLSSINRGNAAIAVQEKKNEQAAGRPPKLDKETAQRILMDVRKENTAAGRKVPAAEEQAEVINRWKRATETAQPQAKLAPGSVETIEPDGTRMAVAGIQYDADSPSGNTLQSALMKLNGEQPRPSASTPTTWAKDWSLKDGKWSQDVSRGEYAGPVGKLTRDRLTGWHPENAETALQLNDQARRIWKYGKDDPTLQDIDAREAQIDFKDPNAWRLANALNQERSRRQMELDPGAGASIHSTGEVPLISTEGQKFMRRMGGVLPEVTAPEGKFTGKKESLPGSRAAYAGFRGRNMVSDVEPPNYDIARMEAGIMPENRDLGVYRIVTNILRSLGI